MKKMLLTLGMVCLLGLSFPSVAKQRQHPIGECAPIAETMAGIIYTIVTNKEALEEQITVVAEKIAKHKQLSDAAKTLLLKTIPLFFEQFKDVTAMSNVELISLYNTYFNMCIEADGQFDDGQPESVGIET